MRILNKYVCECPLCGTRFSFGEDEMETKDAVRCPKCGKLLRTKEEKHEPEK